MGLYFSYQPLAAISDLPFLRARPAPDLVADQFGIYRVPTVPQGYESATLADVAGLWDYHLDYKNKIEFKDQNSLRASVLIKKQWLVNPITLPVSMNYQPAPPPWNGDYTSFAPLVGPGPYPYPILVAYAQLEMNLASGTPSLVKGGITYSREDVGPGMISAYAWSHAPSSATLAAFGAFKLASFEEVVLPLEVVEVLGAVWLNFRSLADVNLLPEGADDPEPPEYKNKRAQLVSADRYEAVSPAPLYFFEGDRLRGVLSPSYPEQIPLPPDYTTFKTVVPRPGDYRLPWAKSVFDDTKLDYPSSLSPACFLPADSHFPVGGGGGSNEQWVNGISLNGNPHPPVRDNPVRGANSGYWYYPAAEVPPPWEASLPYEGPWGEAQSGILQRTAKAYRYAPILQIGTAVGP